MSEEFVKKASLILEKLKGQLSQSMVLDKWLIDQILISILNQGHVLLEAAPGLGKTTLVKVLARLMSLDHQRVQCTPDLMPSDITGMNVYNPESKLFELHKGPVFTQLLLVDEINRTSQYYVDYFTVDYNESTKNAKISMIDNSPEGRRVVTRFLLSNKVSVIIFNENEYKITEFYDNFLKN